jgi:predicted Zn-dependent protease
MFRVTVKFPEKKPRTKPLYISYTPDISTEEISIALDTVNEIINISGTKGRLPVKLLGIWKNTGCEDYLKRGFVHPEKVEDFLNRHRNQATGCVNPDSALMEHVFECERVSQPYYSIILTDSNLFYTNRFVVGGAQPHAGAIISVNNFRKIPNSMLQRETKKQGIFHEVGHVLGLPKRNRGFAIEEKMGYHCTNRCAVRQSMNIDEWIETAEQRLKSNEVYCGPCTKELKDFFSGFRY